MKLKSLLFTAYLSLFVSPFAIAQNAEDIGKQAVTAYKQGNYSQAAKLSEQACNSRFAPSCTDLGVLYEDGQGVKQDYLQAKKLYEKACDNGSQRACHNLALLYKNGKGVKQDNKQAAKFYKKACDSNVSQSCFNLGLLYLNGKGVKQD